MCMFTFRNDNAECICCSDGHIWGTCYKDIIRTQLAGAVKLYAAPGERKELLKLDKKDMIPEVAQMFLREGIVRRQRV